jgi:putative SOS response-associated peptidase YedK
MCGRYATKRDKQKLAEAFQIRCRQLYWFWYNRYMETQMERLRRFADQQTVIRPGDLERLPSHATTSVVLSGLGSWRG